MFHRFAPRRVLAVLLCTVPIAPRIAAAQGDSLPPPPSSNLGLAAIGAVTMHGGWASIQHGFHAGQLGGTVDFGYLTSRRIRLVADATYLLTLPHEETVASEERTYRNVFRDLSAHLALAFHATSPSARFAPYLATGVGVPRGRVRINPRISCRAGPGAASARARRSGTRIRPSAASVPPDRAAGSARGAPRDLPAGSCASGR